MTFKIQWSEENKDRNVKILCGNVEGAGLPVPTYLAILKAISQVEAELNTKPQPEPLVPEEGVESAGREIEDAIKREGDLPVKLKRLVPDTPPPKPKHFYPSPPHAPKTVVSTNKMRKAYTEEEKTEIAQLYQDGLLVNEIARRFGRKPESIYKLVSAMGVKRNQKREYEKPEVIAASDASDQPKAKRECTLKKPWYLQPQVPNNRTKAKHE